MRLLLDTHIWLWSLLEPRRLSRRVARALGNPANELWLSPVSVWELIVLCAKQRVILNEAVESWVGRALDASRLREAPLTHEVALATAAVKLPHRDPADRFLAATARVFDLTLVTADKNLGRSSGFSVLVNR